MKDEYNKLNKKLIFGLDKATTPIKVINKLDIELRYSGCGSDEYICDSQKL